MQTFLNIEKYLCNFVEFMGIFAIGMQYCYRKKSKNDPRLQQKKHTKHINKQELRFLGIF